MIYPKNYEQKIGFVEIRNILKGFCLSTLGKSLVETMAFTDDAEELNVRMDEIREMRRILETADGFPLDNFIDVRDSLKHVRLEGTHLDEGELFDLKRSLQTIIALTAYLYRGDEDDEGNVTYYYPALHDLADGVATFPRIVSRIEQIIDKFGRMRDTASPQLNDIRRELARTEGSISRTLLGILKSAQSEGVVDKDVTPAVRDGRLVIPVAPGLKRRIAGIVHDESATGRTVYIEPTQVVEANNRIRELESDERREIVRILTEISKVIRPYVREMLDSYDFLAAVDFIHAKALFAGKYRAFEPTIADKPYIDWIQARHPLLETHLAGAIVPLDIMLTPDKRMLIISGPNAGGKSVCLKTVALLQYMLQCGMPIPVGDRSRVGVFSDLMIDIGDEQSLENDLSTYSSHLYNMKNMMKQASDRTLILIDEFGTGTEPQIGGAIAESVLKQLWKKGAWAVITTHYQNLKHFADSHDHVANGAMLYDRHLMKPLFRLAIGRPGSSFAIEIARQTGIPEEVIRDASDIVGSDYIQSDKYLQDIVRDKRYWESKRQTIHQKEKELERAIEKYEHGVTDVDKARKEILDKARDQAAELIKATNQRIENTIREIRESQAEKESTKRLRQQLAEYEQGVKAGELPSPTSKGGKVKDHGLMTDDDFRKKVEQINSRKARHERHLAEKAKRKAEDGKRTSAATANLPISVGDSVRIKGLTSVGTVEAVSGKQATVAFGDMRSKMDIGRLERVEVKSETQPASSSLNNLQTYSPGSRMTRQTIDEHRNNFRQEIDVRGMRADEALNAVQHFLDDAILVGVADVHILHGKGNGILRTLIRQYLATVPNVRNFHDEDVRFGGAGITVVEL